MINDLFYEGDTFFTNKNEKILSKETYALELYNMYNTFFSGKDVVTPKVVNGSTHEGKIIRIDTEYVLVDLGYKDYVFCPRKKENVTVLSNIEVEQIVKVYIEKIHDAPYMIEGNISKLFEDDIKTFIFDLIERQEPVPAFIKEWTPAGYMLNININNFDFVAFMPNTIAGVNKLSNPEMLVGKTEMVILESFSQENKTFIASRKRYLETLILQEVSKLKVNQEYTGSVTGTLEYGIFVEFNGCLTGMIYKSNLNDEQAQLLKNGAVQAGQPIKFKVKEIIKSKLTLVQIDVKSAWDNMTIGNDYIGEVVSIKPFGAIIKIDNETKGLIKLTDYKQLNPKVGDKVNVKVLSFDRMNRKIMLQPIKN